MNSGQLPSPHLVRMRQAAEAQSVPEWTGDLADDCTARWAGFTLRAELMEEGVWWWAVSVDEMGCQIASSNDTDMPHRTGAEARAEALRTARTYLHPRQSA